MWTHEILEMEFELDALEIEELQAAFPTRSNIQGAQALQLWVVSLC